jgi:arylsulfatase
MGIDPRMLASIGAANADLDKIGRAGSYVTYGPVWAQASTGPFRRFKGTTNEGGIRTPAFVSGPGIAGGRIYSGETSVRDILPTALELAGVSGATAVESSDGHLPVGASWVPELDGDPTTAMAPHDVMAWEFFFSRAIRRGDWKAVFAQEKVTLLGQQNPDAAPPQWRLYNLLADPGEETDLAASKPEVLKDMIADWERYAAANGVVMPPAPPPGSVRP